MTELQRTIFERIMNGLPFHDRRGILPEVKELKVKKVIKEVIGDIEPEGSNYYASARNGLRRKQYEKARELGFDIKLVNKKDEDNT